jgi:small-conductance mechanosensitive channel
VTVASKVKILAVPKDITSFTQPTENIDQIRTELQAVTIQDSKLKELKEQLLGMYGDVSQSLKSQAKSIETKDKKAMDKAKQELITAAGKESDIVDRLNDLCSK